LKKRSYFGDIVGDGDNIKKDLKEIRYEDVDCIHWLKAGYSEEF
jgi:hypothetical protein